MLPQNPESKPASILGISTLVQPPQESTSAPTKTVAINAIGESMGDDFLRRRQIQKLRWLGLDREADRLAADMPLSNCTASAHLSVEHLETD